MQRERVVQMCTLLLAPFCGPYLKFDVWSLSGQVEKERQDQRLGHVRKAFMAAQQDEGTRHIIWQCADFHG